MAKPYMPTFIGDWLADVPHLSDAEVGSYVLLVWAIWARGPILDDDARLARVARCGLRAWQTRRNVLVGYFLLQNGHWTHARVEKEQAYAAELGQARSESGAAGAEAKWAKQRPEKAKKPAVKATRLAHDWKPSEQDIAYGQSKGLSLDEFNGCAERFRRYFTGADAKRPAKKDWHRAFTNWIDTDYDRLIAARAHRNGRGGNGQGRRGLADAVRDILDEDGAALGGDQALRQRGSDATAADGGRSGPRPEDSAGVFGHDRPRRVLDPVD